MTPDDDEDQFAARLRAEADMMAVLLVRLVIAADVWADRGNDGNSMVFVSECVGLADTARAVIARIRGEGREVNPDA